MMFVWGFLFVNLNQSTESIHPLILYFGTLKSLIIIIRYIVFLQFKFIF